MLLALLINICGITKLKIKQMKKSVIIAMFLIYVFQYVKAQDTTQVASANTEQKTPLSEKIYYGGNIGLSFGSYTMIGIYPLIAYKMTPKLSIGAKIAYEYIQDKRYSETYSTSNYGASIFTRYRVLRPLYLHVEFAGLNYELYDILGESNREWIPFLFVGAGYSQPIGKNTWLNVQILFDVLQNEKSPYENWTPFYNVGIGVGF